MIGKLDPEERVMEDSVMYPGGMLGQLSIALEKLGWEYGCLLYTSPSPRDAHESRMPSSA